MKALAARFLKLSALSWLVSLTLVLSVASLIYRHRVEHDNRTVGLAMEMAAINDLAANAGQPVPDVLRRLKGQGLTAVTLSADSMAGLLQRQEIMLDGSRSPFLIVRSPDVAQRVRFALSARFGSGPWEEPPLREEGMQLVPIGNVRLDSVLAISLGLSPVDTQFARDAGLQIIARHGNPSGANERYIEAMLGRSSELGATMYLAEGDQVLGQRDLLGVTTETLEKLGMLYVSPEFAKIAGDAVLAGKNIDNLVRLHSIQQSELDRMSEYAVVERLAKAYRERNIRVLLLRPLSNANEDPVDSAAHLVASVRTRVERFGGTVGPPKPFADPGVPRPLLLAIGFGIALVVAWTGLRLVSNPRWRLAGIAFLFILAMACWTRTGRELMALVAAIVFPIAAFASFDEKEFRPFGEYIRISFISLVGGLSVAGILDELPYIARIDQFPGVKLAHFMPILVVGLLLLSRRVNWRDVVRSPITWGAAMVALAGLAVLGLMMIRTGNEGPAAVSGLEIAFRNTLDAVLYTRPRTKEFLFGNPALLIGLFLLASANRAQRLGLPSEVRASLGTALLAVGVIGQTSIVNTMCHLHTPLTLSLIRILTGWVVGGILGALLWALFRAKWPVRRA